MEENNSLNQEKDLIQEVSLPIFKAKGWMKLIGIVSIIYGIAIIFTIVGIAICWLPIWLGILLLKASKSIEIAQINGDRQQLNVSLSNIKTYFVINGILLLIGLIGFIIALSFYGTSIFSLYQLPQMF